MQVPSMDGCVSRREGGERVEEVVEGMEKMLLMSRDDDRDTEEDECCSEEEER